MVQCAGDEGCPPLVESALPTATEKSAILMEPEYATVSPSSVANLAGLMLLLIRQAKPHAFLLLPQACGMPSALKKCPSSHSAKTKNQVVLSY
jgi:hypothetical protein